jgi:hypothetical protein
VLRVDPPFSEDGGDGHPGYESTQGRSQDYDIRGPINSSILSDKKYCIMLSSLSTRHGIRILDLYKLF